MTIDEEKLATGAVQRVLNRAMDYVENRIFDEVAAYNARQPDFLKDYCHSKIAEISSVKNILYSREPVELQSIYVAASLEIAFDFSNHPITVPDSLFSDIFFKSMEASQDKIAEHLAQSRISEFDETTAQDIDPKILAQLREEEEHAPKRETSAYIVSGGAGAGKTIFLKHMCLNAIQSSKPYLPIYLEVRRLSSTSDLVISMVDELNRYGETEISRKYLMAALRAGLFAICIDGFDEVDPKERSNLEGQIRGFVTKYELCPLIVSGRDMTAYHSWENFSAAKVCDFSTDMSVELIQKSLVPQLDKENLISYVRNDIPDGYVGFLKSPLMVTVLILTATEVNRVSDNLLNFLEDAFEALWWRHDIKKSGYARVVVSKLSKSEFKNFFSAFCAASYFAEAIELNEVQLQRFVSKARARLLIEASEEDLIYDMRINVCLLLQDGGRYFFGHRLFQEYFCAGFVNSLSGNQYIRAIEMAEKRSATDEVLRFVLEMDQEKVERDFVLPVLQVLIKTYKVERCSLAAYQRVVLGGSSGWLGRKEPDEKIRIHLNAIRSMYKLKPSVNDIRELQERSKDKDIRYSAELIEALLGDDRRNIVELHNQVLERVKRHSDIDSLFD